MDINSSNIKQSLKKFELLIYYFTLTITSAAILYDLIIGKFSNEINLLNFSTLILVCISLALQISHKLSLRINYGIIVYVILLNVLITNMFNPTDKSMEMMFMRDSLSVIILIPMIGILVNRIHSIIFGTLYISVYFALYFISKSPFLEFNLGAAIVIIGGYSVSMYFVIGVLTKGVNEQEELTKQIWSQNEELTIQARYLSDINQMLNKQTIDIKTQQKELEKLNSTKDKFLSLLAHDLKTPLNSIIGFSELLTTQFDKIDREKQLKYLKIINKASKSTYSLLENLLEWSRAQSSHLTYIPAKYPVSEILDEIINLLKPAANHKNIDLKVNSEGEMKVFADRHMLVTILRNLVSNAIKYSRANSEVIVDIEQENNQIQFSVTDQGVGMSEEKINSLFQIENSESSVGTSGETGTGLGLIISNDFLKKHGSTLEISSKPGEGARFSFKLNKA